MLLMFGVLLIVFRKKLYLTFKSRKTNVTEDSNLQQRVEVLSMHPITPPDNPTYSF